MKELFKRLSLPVKLMLIGIVPLAFYIYLSIELYLERQQKVELFASYIERLHRSADITRLINEMQEERKFSFEHALMKNMKDSLHIQRPLTDSAMRKLIQYGESLDEFRSYTFLENLQDVRNALDSGYMQPNLIMDYYSSSIYRLNTLNALPSGSYIYLRPVFKDLVAQKLLSEMITFLGIMSANIYNGLYTRQYVVEMLVGTAGTYRVYKSYEREFDIKASEEAKKAYHAIKSGHELFQTNKYVDTALTKFHLDSTYTPFQWQSISTTALEQLKSLQQKTLQHVQDGVSRILKEERAKRNRTLIFLIFSMLFVSGVVFYTARSITSTLRELKTAARAISRGAPATPIHVMSRDMVGSLASSIKAIDDNNKQLAQAAYAIGKGRFDVAVEPRSREDVLGNAVVTMKSNLQKFTTDLTASNSELERFAYVASHDLQEPLRMVSSFLHLLEKRLGPDLDDTNKQYINFAVDGAERMKSLIQDLLLYSRVGTNKEKFADVDCNEILDMVTSVLSFSIREANAIVTVKKPLPVIRALPAQMQQVFQNLIGNAIKYRREVVPEVEVGCNDKGNDWEFYVKDNGIGIDSRFFDKIFVIFQRLHNKNEFSGTGIGLSICKKIVEKHNGKIYVESVTGKGSTFYFTIPKNQS